MTPTNCAPTDGRREWILRRRVGPTPCPDPEGGRRFEVNGGTPQDEVGLPRRKRLRVLPWSVQAPTGPSVSSKSFLVES